MPTLTAAQKSFNIDQHAEVYHKLMQSLGYDEYGKLVFRGV